MRTLMVSILLTFTFIPLDLANGNSNNCSFATDLECNHNDSINSDYKINIGSDVSNFHISADGEYIIFSDPEKFHIIDVEKEKIIHSEFLIPDYNIGLDYKTGLLYVGNSSKCKFPTDTSIHCGNTTLMQSEPPAMYSWPENFIGSFHSDDYLVCDIIISVWGDKHCEEGDGPILVSPSYKEGASISPDGKFEIFFGSYLSNEDMVYDDYDGIVSVGRIESWNVSDSNGNGGISRSLSLVEVGIHFEAYNEDDVYSMTWSYDSKYVYVITCKDLIGIDVETMSTNYISSNPLSCPDDDFSDDSVNLLQKPTKISLDGSTLAYLDGKHLIVFSLEKSTWTWYEIAGVILASLVVIGVGFVGYQHWRTKKTSHSNTLQNELMKKEKETLSKSTVKELKVMLKEQGLPVSGTKMQLIERLLQNEVNK